VSSLELGRDIVILACAISAGIHGVLVPDHFEEGTGAGLGFAAATGLLAALVVALTLRPTSVLALAGAAAVLLALLVSYALATTTGVPLLHPDPEPVDALAVSTKAIESVGLLAALNLLGRGRPAVARTVPQPKGTLT
jgi:nitrate/nitrite transporter NarK